MARVTSSYSRCNGHLQAPRLLRFCQICRAISGRLTSLAHTAPFLQSVSLFRGHRHSLLSAAPAVFVLGVRFFLFLIFATQSCGAGLDRYSQLVVSNSSAASPDRVRVTYLGTN